MRHLNITLKVAIVALALLSATDAFALGSDQIDGVEIVNSDEGFAQLLGTLVGFSQGALGKSFAIGTFLVGMGMGVVKQSIMAFVVGLAMALAMAFGPGVLLSMFSVTLTSAPVLPGIF